MSRAGEICLIMSGAYVDAELAAEFGRLPPSFLPVGSSRLYELQVAAFGGRRPIHMTLPEGFQPPPEDLRRFAELGIEVLELPRGLGLGQAVVAALERIGGEDRRLHLLHGDTLIPAPPLGRDDVISAAADSDAYSWAEITLDGDRVKGIATAPAGASRDLSRPIAAGYFGLSSGARLAQAIMLRRGDFIGGLDAYAQERSVTAVPVADWLDFGHVQTYFRSRRAVATARAFNTLRIDGRTVRKSSADGAKMRAESAWFRELPPSLRIFAVNLIDGGEAADGSFYETEYEYVPTLAELFVFGRLPNPVWGRILASCRDFLSLAAGVRGPGSGDRALRLLAVDKTFERLAQFGAATGFDIDAPLALGDRPAPSLNRLAAMTGALIQAPTGRAETVMHGDFCFSNILYNSRTARIKVIDPRGFVEPARPCCFGDTRYDLAKIAHSILGRYDQIIAGRYALSESGHSFAIGFEDAPHQLWLEAALGDFAVDGIRGMAPAVLATMVGLFLSMLPLHADRPDRQRAFIANALRLFQRLEVLAG